MNAKPKPGILKLAWYLVILIMIFIIYSKIYKEYSVVYTKKDQSIERINYIEMYYFKVLENILSVFSSKEVGSTNFIKEDSSTPYSFKNFFSFIDSAK